MTKRIFALFAYASIVLMIEFIRVDAQGEKPDLTEKKITIQVINKPLNDVFIKLMYEYDVPIGFEESTLDKDHNDYFFQTIMPPHDKRNEFPGEPQTISSGLPTRAHLISLDFKDARLKYVLDEIVKQMQNYDWGIDDGVVNIFPIKGRDPKFEELLGINIQEFVMSKGEQYSDLQPMIVYNLSEFKIFLTKNKLNAESDRYVPSYSDLPIPIELKFTNITFKQLLNKIIKLKQGGWILRASKHKGLQKTENKSENIIELLI